MGLVLDSGVLIAAERDAKPVSELLATLEQEHGETEIVLSSIRRSSWSTASIAPRPQSRRGNGVNTWILFSRQFR